MASFEVVSIKPDRSGAISTQYSPNRFTATYKNAKFFIKMAYGSSQSRYTYPLRAEAGLGVHGAFLEPTRGPMDVLVIDHIEMPTEN